MVFRMVTADGKIFDAHAHASQKHFFFSQLYVTGPVSLHVKVARCVRTKEETEGFFAT